MPEKPSVLIVEDDINLSHINRKVLEKEGYAVTEAATLAAARDCLSTGDPDIILLDVGLPDGSGVEFCREIRDVTAAHIIFLTATGDPGGEFEGLRSGGDDYLVKPYAIKLLRERVKNAIGRREGSNLIRRGELVVDTKLLRARIGEDEIALSHREFSLLLLLIRHEDLPLTGEYLYESVWGVPAMGDTRALKNTIYRLRKKIYGSGYTIYAEYNKGYIFERE